MAALRLAKGLARTLIPTTSPDFPLSLLFKALLLSIGTAPWKRHSLLGHAPDVVSSTSPLPIDLHTDYRLSKILINLHITPYILPTNTSKIISRAHGRILKAYARADRNTGDLVQREHAQN